MLNRSHLKAADSDSRVCVTAKGGHNEYKDLYPENVDISLWIFFI